MVTVKGINAVLQPNLELDIQMFVYFYKKLV